MCRVFSYVVGRGCLLWPVHFLGKTLLVFALLHSAFQGPRDHLSAITNKIQTSCWVRPLFLFPLFTQQTFTEGLSCVKNWARIMTINRNICCSCLVSKSCLPLYNPTAWGPPGSSVHEISQARMLEWVSLSFSRGSSWPKDWTRVSCTAGRFFTIRATAAAAKSLQSCLTLCDPIDGSPPGSPVPGILQARTLEWVSEPLGKPIFLDSTYKRYHMIIVFLCLTSLSMTISRSIHVAANGIILWNKLISYLLVCISQQNQDWCFHRKKLRLA